MHEPTTMHPRRLRAELEAMESLLVDLCEELEEYEQLKSADLSVISVAAFDELADGLIKARIAAVLSQGALAQCLELKEQQIQRYEAEQHASASYRRLREVERALGFGSKTRFSFQGPLAKVIQVRAEPGNRGRAPAVFGGRRAPGESNHQRLTANAASVS